MLRPDNQTETIMTTTNNATGTAVRMYHIVGFVKWQMATVDLILDKFKFELK